MISNKQRKKILKQLKSRHVIERLDGLHELKAVGIEADFAMSELENLLRKDSDDLVRMNTLDVFANISEKTDMVELFIKNALNDESIGVKKKAEKILAMIDRRDEEPHPDEEAPLSNELFEKIEDPILESSIDQTVQVKESDEIQDISFNLEEISVGETTELQPNHDNEIPIPSPPDAKEIPTTPQIPPPMITEPVPEAVPEPPEPPEIPEFIPSLKEDEIVLIELGDAPLENSLKNLLLLSKKTEETSENDVDQLENINQKITIVLDQVADHLNNTLGLSQEDINRFSEYQFDEKETEYLRNIILLFSTKLRNQITKTESIPQLILLGVVAQKFSLLDESIGIYKLILKLDKTNIAVLNNLGMLYAKTDKIDEAIEQFTTITEIEQDNAKFYAMIGDLLSFRKQDYDEAAKYYTKSLEIDPSIYSTGMNLASALSKQEKYDEATSVLHLCLKTNPDVPDLWLNYAVLLVKQLNFNEAVEAYSKALELAPADWRFKDKAETEKTRVEELIETPEFTESKDEELEYMVDKDKKIEIERVFIFSENLVDDQVYIAVFDWFKNKKHKYSIAEELEPLYGSIMNKDDFPIDPLRAKDFAELIWNEYYSKDLDISKFHHELFDLEEFDKVIFFMEEK
ncbi:MAG: tetratricopeptide repeat protein [Candidatus Heimdallarchaeota archaeon]